MNFTTIDLAGGGIGVIPLNARLLNPKEEGRKHYAYYAWPIDLDDSNYLDAINTAMDEDAPFPVCIFFTDRLDLYKMGAEARADTPFSRATPLLKDYAILCNYMREACEESPLAGKNWGFAFTRINCSGEEVPLGICDGTMPDLVLRYAG